LGKVFVYGLISSIVFIALTLTVDTYFWREYFDQRLRKSPDETFYMWPELYVLHYNTVLNKSHEWGTSPWYWYFLIAMPKSVTCSLLFIGIGLVYQKKNWLVDWNIVEAISPAIIFVGLYSILPHKELRFIFPALTLLNLGGALGLAKM
jgi:alpha-1,6-mannosyltransferase